MLEDPRTRGKLLHGEHAGFWRFRIGDYRVVALIEDRRLVIVAIAIGHRSNIYK
ncbi:MAG TPA: type II toxin-antitoxin system RelE/ParE family toxin [Trueperaceae bacterium]|nr:type II toxin-antitoxin system RelE/ParE family toxin [Trueperaceae bacterium]